MSGLFEFGTLVPVYGADRELWQVNRLTVNGTHGYVWAETTGIWGALTKHSNGEVLNGEGPGYSPGDPGAGWESQVNPIQTLYARDISDWFLGKTEDHPCSLTHAFTGFELFVGACISALKHIRIDLPLSESHRNMDVFGQMKELLPECPPRS